MIIPINLKKQAGQKNKKFARPTILLGVGNTKIEEWIGDFFRNQADVICCSDNSDELKQRITDCHPDILVIMRKNSVGGIPEAGSVAEMAAPHVPAVLFIIGELDEEGSEMLEKAREAGVRHVITCEKGGQIYGDELVYSLSGILRDLEGIVQKDSKGNEEKAEGGGVLSLEAQKTLNSLFLGAGSIGKAIIQSAGAVSEKARGRATVIKRDKPRINRTEGISISESGGHIENFFQGNPTAIVQGGLLAVVSPWRPGLAGRLAAQAVKMFSEVEGCVVSYIGASGNSTGALWLEVPDNELIMSDWRIPGSTYPITRDNIRIFAVDPVKDLHPGNENDLMPVLGQARKDSDYTVVDLAGNIASARKVAAQGRSVLLVVIPGGDPVETRVSSIWLKNIMEGKQNIVTGLDMRGGFHETIPEGLNPRLVINNSPADALRIALRKQGDNVFIWN
ncbi:MAG: hypothetical protein ACOY46_03400 [Bacillota bacterium]